MIKFYDKILVNDKIIIIIINRSLAKEAKDRLAAKDLLDILQVI